MPTDSAILAQLQALWRVPPGAALAICPAIAETAMELQAEIQDVVRDEQPAGDQASGVFDPFDWFDEIEDADQEYLLGRHRYPERCGFCGGHYLHNRACVALCDEWTIKMPFGKYKGQNVADVPPDYLRWLLSVGRELDAELRREIERVLKIE